MANFYDTWLGLWDQTQKQRQRATKAIHEEELVWLSTPQDSRVALLCAPETGFSTWGTETMIAEIPVGWHTGKHAHGEEGIYILEGEGFSVIKLAGGTGHGLRFDWAKDSTVWIPFGAEHQHFNTGKAPVRYFSIMAIHLEHWLGLGKLDQIEKAGETRVLPDVPASDSGLDTKGRRIILRAEDTPWHGPQGAWSRHARSANLMRSELGFKNFEIQIWGILSNAPNKRLSGKHAHMEAILYILDGEGYTIVDGEKVAWRKGSCVHVQGPQTVHEHFCTSTQPYSMLRCAPGIRTNFAHYCALERFPFLRFPLEGDSVDEIREVNLEDGQRRLGG